MLRGGSTVNVRSDVTETDNGNAIQAVDAETKVTVEGNVSEADSDNAIKATLGAKVTVNKDVTESGEGHAIEADGSGTTVTVKGNVTESGNNNAIYAKNGAVVIVYGSVSEDGNGTPINATVGSKVKVGGNVAADDCESIIMASDTGTEIVIEEKVTGIIEANNESSMYIGALDGVIEMGDNNIHYLIGTAAESPFTLNDVTLTSDIVANETIDGIIKGGYRYTTTAGQTALSGHQIILTPAAGKILTVSGLENIGNQVACDSFPDGSVTLTFLDEFKGGLQNLMLTIQGLFTAVFDADGGSPEPESQKVREGGKVQKPSTNPAKSGYTFRYWAADGTAYDFEKAVDGDITLVAVWDKNGNRSSGSSGGATIFTGTTGNPVNNGKWTKNADGTWSYATTGKFANTWGYIANPNDAGSAAWYYFDGNGNMLTGWQKLYWKGAYKWYYFSQTKDANEGKCQLGGVTPDGYIVDESGAWIEN